MLKLCIGEREFMSWRKGLVYGGTCGLALAIIVSCVPANLFAFDRIPKQTPNLPNGSPFCFGLHYSIVVVPPEEDGTLEEMIGPSWNLTILSAQGDIIEVNSTRDEFPGSSNLAQLNITEQFVTAFNYSYSCILDMNGSFHLTDLRVELTHPYFLPCSWSQELYAQVLNRSFQPDLVPPEWKNACGNLTTRSRIELYPGSGIRIKNLLLEEPLKVGTTVIWQQKTRHIIAGLYYQLVEAPDMPRWLVRMLDLYYLIIEDQYANGTRVKYTKHLVLQGWNATQPPSSSSPEFRPDGATKRTAGWQFIRVTLILLLKKFFPQKKEIDHLT